MTLETQAFVLHSGGIDSTTCLYHAIKNFGSENTTAISVYYGQRHRKEIECSQAICTAAGVKHRTIKLADQPPSMLTDDAVEIPSVDYADIKGVSPTYVPFRNGQLLSYITAVAHGSLATDDAGHLKQQGVVYFGAHAEDAYNWAYPDCTPEFIGAMANAIYIGTYNYVRLATPLEWLGKADIVKLGTELCVPWQLTWSCYKGEDLHCGVCPTCRARIQGFRDAGVMDPTEYKNKAA